MQHRSLAMQKCRLCGRGPGTLRLEGRYLVCGSEVCKGRTVAELDETEAREHEAEEKFGTDWQGLNR